MSETAKHVASVVEALESLQAQSPNRAQAAAAAERSRALRNWLQANADARMPPATEQAAHARVRDFHIAREQGDVAGALDEAARLTSELAGDPLTGQKPPPRPRD